MDNHKKRELSSTPSPSTNIPPAKSGRMEDKSESTEILTFGSPEDGSSFLQLAPPPDVQQLAVELLHKQLSTSSELSEQNKTIVRFTVSITAELISAQNKFNTQLQYTVNNLSRAVTKMEQDVIHYETLISKQSASLDHYPFASVISNSFISCIKSLTFMKS